jgi:hypothetical protein
MSTPINLDLLKAFDEKMWQVVVYNIKQTSGTHEVDISDLPESPANKMKLAEWSLKRTAAQPAEPQINMMEVLREQEEGIQRSIDQQQGMARMEQYADQQGLERTPANGDAVAKWLNENLTGYLSSAGVDAAIQWLGPKGKNVLTWTPKTAPVESLAAPAGEVLADWQLPLGADERMMKASSVKALQDLIKRRRAATNQMYVRRGGFSSTF